MTERDGPNRQTHQKSGPDRGTDESWGSAALDVPLLNQAAEENHDLESSSLTSSAAIARSAEELTPDLDRMRKTPLLGTEVSDDTKNKAAAPKRTQIKRGAEAIRSSRPQHSSQTILDKLVTILSDLLRSFENFILKRILRQADPPEEELDALQKNARSHGSVRGKRRGRGRLSRSVITEHLEEFSTEETDLEPRESDSARSTTLT